MRVKDFKKRPSNGKRNKLRRVLVLTRKQKRAASRTKKNLPREKNYADTMSQAAGILQKPLALIQAAKESGCRAFRHSRVYISELKNFLDGNPELIARSMRIADIEERQKIADAEFAEERAKRLRKESLPTDLVRRTVKRHELNLKFKAFAIPRRISSVFAIETDPIIIEEKLTAEIRALFLDSSKNEWGTLICPHCKKEIET